MIDLIDREALKAAYKAAHKGEPGGAWKLICEAPTVEVPQWISVKERMPEKSFSQKDRVLVNVAPPKAFNFKLGLIDTDRTVDGKTFVRWGDRVTHWMPVPNPPKEEKE